MAFLCTSCGKEHDTLPEPAYRRPDDVWALSAEEKAVRVTGGNDFCSLAGEGAMDLVRYFIRGRVQLAVPEIGDNWSVGVWAEVAESSFHRYRELYDSDASGEPRFSGVLANAAKGFEDAFRSQKSVQLGNETQRPTFWFTRGCNSSLGQLQQSGVTLERIHSVLGGFE